MVLITGDVCGLAGWCFSQMQHLEATEARLAVSIRKVISDYAKVS